MGNRWNADATDRDGYKDLNMKNLCVLGVHFDC